MSLLFLSLFSIAQAEPSWPDISKPIPNIGVNTSKDSALIIAIEDYSYAPDVVGAVQNGKDWEQYFIQSAGIPLSRIRFLSNDQAYQDAIMENAHFLNEKTPPGGKIWVIYIGHGANYNNEPIFLDVDARQTDISFKKSLQQKELLGILEQKHDVIALIDACFSGRDTQGLALLTGVQPMVLSSMLEMPKTTILTAASSDQFAGDLPYLPRPSFSYLALGAMRGWGDRDQDGQVSLSEVKSYTEDTIASVVVGRRQTPTITGAEKSQIVSKGREQAPDLQPYRSQSSSTRQTGASTAVVEGGDFSLDVVGEANRLAEQIARLERLITADLDNKEQEIKGKANRQWNSTDFRSLRSSNPKVAVETVNRFVDAYSDVVVKYPEQVSIPISVSLSRKVSIPEVTEARDWLRENGTPDVIDGGRYPYKAVLIPAGTFTMGCTSEQGSDCVSDEKPVHKVTISKDFYMMESEVTQALYESVMRSNPSHVKGANRPVENVSWYDAVNFANKLSALEGREQCYQINGENVSWNNKDCKGWRLPTEAEWEYAARGGQSYKYAGSNSVDEVGWNNEDFARGHHDVCGKTKNGYGLCDMSGNVWEWVFDWYGDYSTENQSNPQGKSTGSYRVLRGGSWYHSPKYLRVSLRSYYSPDIRYNGLGFRLELLP